MKDKILKEIIDCYTMSNEAKGLPFKNIKNFNKVEEVIELVEEDKIQVLHVEDTMNPFVKNYNVRKETKTQIEDLKSNPNECVLYPSEKVVIELRPDKGLPYSTLSKNSNVGRNDLIYFKQEVLRKYVDYENYKVQNNGFNYNVITTDEAVDKGLEFIQIRHCAPSRKPDSNERSLATTLNELNNLPSKEQMYWSTFEIEDQKEWIVNEGFKKAYLIGEWLDEVWFYDEIINNISLINKMCINANFTPLFQREFKFNLHSQIEQIEKPKDYNPILNPNLKEYKQFLLTLNNMVVENINKDFFKNLERLNGVEIKFKAENGTDYGTINLLEQFLKCILKDHENNNESKEIIKEIIPPLKEIRKIRNSIHKIEEFKADNSYYEKQEEIVEKIYNSTFALLSFFGAHPINYNEYSKIEFYKPVFY